ncbi:MAG: nucleotidyltransferase domain-containing protein [Candidatus Woesearchaeota archaeon]
MNISKTELVILDYLSKKQGDGSYGRQISKDTGISAGAASQGLRNLEKKGVIRKSTQGRETYYSADPDSPLIQSFRRFINMLDIMPLAARLKKVSKKVVLYGSCSQGTDTEDSDIDLFVLTENKEEAKRVINKFRLEVRRISALTVNMEDMMHMKTKDRALYSRIMKGLVLWDGKNEL